MRPASSSALLSPESYTATRLQNATPEHLYLTSRRCFIGPVPLGWLRHHRRDYYSSSGAKFEAQPGTGKRRYTTNLEDRQNQKQSFQQPEPSEDDEGDVEDVGDTEGEEDAGVTAEETPAEASAEQQPIIVKFHEGEEPPKSSDRVKEVQAQLQPLRDKQARRKRTPALLSLDGEASLDRAMGRTPEQTDPMQSSTRVGDKREAAPTTRGSFKTAKTRLSRRGSGTALSFVTARTSLSKPDVDGQREEELDTTRKDSANHLGNVAAEENASTAPLLSTKSGHGGKQHQHEGDDSSAGFLNRIEARIKPSDTEGQQTLPDLNTPKRKRTNPAGPVRFNIPEDELKVKEHYIRGKVAQMSRRTNLKRLTREAKDGEIVKIEKMLVRIEYTEHDLPDDFDENDSQKIDSRTLDKWKEFMVVCRESIEDDSDFILQLYKTRVIKAVEETRVRRKSAYEIKLRRKSTQIGIFSALDKTIVIWEPNKTGHRFYIMRPRSGVHAMEWFTFIRGILGSPTTNILKVSVPDLKVHLIIDHPFDSMDKSEHMERAVGGDDEALVRTVQKEQDVAQDIVKRCLQLLGEAPEWKDVVKRWTKPPTTNLSFAETTSTSAALTNQEQQLEAVESLAYQPVGLAWKRYDRLEWVHGANERQMYGTVGMERTHELELRPKQHYPTTHRGTSDDQLVEPPPIEGFLIRLTSQRGTEARMGKLFFKRLYFSTHNQYLVFNKPAQAHPPPPPKSPTTDKFDPREMIEKTPLIFSVNPYPLEDGKIAWLDNGKNQSAEEVIRCDLEAFHEAKRVVNLLLKCDGNINLCYVRTVRNVQRGAVPGDEEVDEGSDVDFHEDLDDNNDRDDGTVKEFDDDRTFELVLHNGLIIRLQAYSKATKIEWQKRLRSLIKYWKPRQAADIALYRSVRQQNLDTLKIDEEMEALIGQFARKWEVTQSYASPELYNMCGISCCRAVRMSGYLYRKPRMRGTFSKNLAILSHGHLMIFAGTLRSLTGRPLAHVHHARLTSLDLRDCYVYSGLITDNDLLYTERAPDSTSRPGHHGLPRMYLEDDWSSTDQDTMTCFVIWHGNKTSWFRSDKSGKDEKRRTRLKKVTQLGVEGKSVVFKTRSRAERDHWVLNINMEIERLAREDDVRIVET